MQILHCPYKSRLHPLHLLCSRSSIVTTTLALNVITNKSQSIHPDLQRLYLILIVFRFWRARPCCQLLCDLLVRNLSLFFYNYITVWCLSTKQICNTMWIRSWFKASKSINNKIYGETYVVVWPLYVIAFWS